MVESQVQAAARVPRAEPLRQMELEVVREVAQAFLTATSPSVSYRLALARLTPLVRALQFGLPTGP